MRSGNRPASASRRRPETNSARRGSDRSTAKRLTSSAGNVSAESIRTSHFVKPYGTSSDWKFDGGAAVCGDIHGLGGGGFAVHDERNRARGGRGSKSGDHGLHVRFLGSHTCPGALTLSTVQFGTASLATGCRTSETFAGSASSEKLPGMADFCMSLKKCSSMGVRTFPQGAYGAREFAVIRARIPRLHVFDGGTQRGRILRRLREHLDLRAERHHLRACRWVFARTARKAPRARVGQARSGAHAEGIVDDQQLELFAVHASRPSG
jgi:hypothetical protein